MAAVSEITVKFRVKEGQIGPGILPGIVTYFDHECSRIPDRIRVSFEDGTTAVYELKIEQPHPIIAENIKNGVTILGVEGTYSGQAISVEANKNATPTTSQQVITPSSGYDYLAQVTVAAIPYTETDNASGGKTVTIAGS